MTAVLIGAGEARAQTETEYWSATLTRANGVGDPSVSLGYVAATETGPGGMLDPSTFTYAGVLYTVKRLYVTPGFIDIVSFQTSPALPNDAGLVLRVPTFKTDDDLTAACFENVEYQDFPIDSANNVSDEWFRWGVPFDAEENGTAAGTVEAEDSDAGDLVTGYAITGGADAGFFSLGATSGALTFQAPPDFADPRDADDGNTYEVTVQATGGAGDREQTETQTITVTVMDADEGQSGTVSIDDTAPMVGDALTASTANVADPDGLPDPFAPTWQWYRTPADGAEAVISGAASATYTVVAADLGAALTAKASWTDVGGFANTLASAPTAAVTRAAATPAAPTGFTAMQWATRR